MLSAASLSGCVAVPAVPGERPPLSPADTAAPSATFEGTPDEYTVLLRGCLEDHGVATANDLKHPNNTTTFVIPKNGGMTDDERNAVITTCRDELGTTPMKGLPADELQARYEVRVDQWSCLLDEGLVSGPPISFDLFISDYERSGQRTLWEPTDGLQPVVKDGTYLGPSDVCPRAGTAW